MKKRKRAPWQRCREKIRKAIAQHVRFGSNEVITQVSKTRAVGVGAFLFLKNVTESVKQL